MSDEATAVAEFSADTKEMGDKIAEMTLKQAKELSDYLKDVHGIEPATGGGVDDGWLPAVVKVVLQQLPNKPNSMLS